MRTSYLCRIALAMLIGCCAATSVHAQTHKTVLRFSSPIPVLDAESGYDNRNATLPGVIYHIRVEVVISHPTPPDIDLVLYTDLPNLRALPLMSDVGSSSLPWVERRIVFDDCARRTLDEAQLPDGAYRPTNVGMGDSASLIRASDSAFTWDYRSASLSEFNGAQGNGVFGLYLLDDRANALGGTIHSAEITIFTQESAQTTRNATPCVKPDYDGDGRVDTAVYRPEDGNWYISQSGSNGALHQVAWGAPASSGADDVAVPADYDGDGLTDVAVFRRTSADWWVIHSFNGSMTKTTFGATSASGVGDTPVPGDYTGDGVADKAVYRTSTGEWFVMGSNGNVMTATQWGYPPTGDYPAR
jgi:hypothetical protein